MIRLLLVDDHSVFLSGVRLCLKPYPDIEIVGEARNGAEAVELAASLRPDVVLMDVEMPVLDGVQATRRIQQQTPSARVILLTTFDHDSYVFEGLRAGAAGYLLKDTDFEEIARAIRETAAGRSWLHPAVAAKVVAELARTPASAAPADNPLSEREQIILRLVAGGTSNKDIALQLGYAEGTIKYYLSGIMQKLGARDRAHAAMLARDQGYI